MAVRRAKLFSRLASEHHCLLLFRVSNACGTGQSQINTQNFLGTGGKLARAFTALVRDLAANAGGVVDRSGALPAFKATLGNFAPVFAGFQQQDAMEFFNQFTSLIHEDLNRIKKKPYVEVRGACVLRD